MGSHLMAALLSRGERVLILGRPRGTETLESRIKKLLAWFGIAAQSSLIETVEVDLLRPCLGLTQSEYQALCAKSGRIIHCASDTRFSERNRPESARTNVESLKEILNLAEYSEGSFFHYVSTAYVAGRTSAICHEAPADTDGFANVYEETKALAERQVAAGCAAKDIPYTILRPSIVNGDSQTGRTNRFNALYYHVKSLYYIRDIYLKDILNQGGAKSGEWGIRLDQNGALHLPLHVLLAKRGYVNLIPIDYFVSTVLSILERPESAKIYHITSDSPKTTEEIASYCESWLRMKGIKIVYERPSNGRLLNPAEALFNRFIETYRPYLSDTRIFERSNTDQASAGRKPPEFTYDIFKRCMDYAVSVNWGNSLQ